MFLNQVYLSVIIIISHLDTLVHGAASISAGNVAASMKMLVLFQGTEVVYLKRTGKLIGDNYLKKSDGLSGYVYIGKTGRSSMGNYGSFLFDKYQIPFYYCPDWRTVYEGWDLYRREMRCLWYNTQG